MDSSVYANGELAASHPYGYTGFAVDLTNRVHIDGRTPTASNQPTTIAFDGVRTDSLRLKLISPHPNESDGFFQIAELQVP